VATNATLARSVARGARTAEAGGLHNGRVVESDHAHVLGHTVSSRTAAATYFSFFPNPLRTFALFV